VDHAVALREAHGSIEWRRVDRSGKVGGACMHDRSAQPRRERPPFWKRAVCFLAGIAVGLFCAYGLSRLLGITPASGSRSLVHLARQALDEPRRIIPPGVGTVVALLVMRGLGRAWGYKGEDIY